MAELLSYDPHTRRFSSSEGSTNTYNDFEDVESAYRTTIVQVLNRPLLAVFSGIDILNSRLLGPLWSEDPALGHSVVADQREAVVRILSLQIRMCKASLDLLIGGNYSLSFAALRHINEAILQIVYLHAKPDEAGYWLRGNFQRQSIKTNNRVQSPSVPKMKRTIDEWLASSDTITAEDRDAVSTVLDQVSSSIDWLSMGSHSTHEGVLQTQGINPTSIRLTPSIILEFLIPGLDELLACQIHLVEWMTRLVPQRTDANFKSNEWITGASELRRRVLLPLMSQMENKSP